MSKLSDRQMAVGASVTLTDILDEDLDKESSGKHRIIDLGNNKMHIKSEDPHGFWYITLAHGALPSDFAGAYTSFSLALAAANQYLTKKNKSVFLPDKE